MIWSATPSNVTRSRAYAIDLNPMVAVYASATRDANMTVIAMTVSRMVNPRSS